MNYGFVKVAAAVPHVKVADCKFNVEKIESLIAVAEGKGVQIIIFPEMSITGYTCGDVVIWVIKVTVKMNVYIQLSLKYVVDLFSFMGLCT